MIDQLKQFFRGPWTAGKIWTLVSVSLSVAGIANVTQNFMDLGSLVVHVLVFYNQVFGPIARLFSLVIPFEISRYVIDYFVIGSVIYHVLIAKSLKPLITFLWLQLVRKIGGITTPRNIVPRFTYYLMFLSLTSSILLWPLFVVRLLFSDRTTTAHGAAYNELPKKVLTRIGLVLTLFFIFATVSFGIERWIDPDYLKLKPEHLGIETPVDTPDCDVWSIEPGQPVPEGC